jgi:hypothetical protein
MAHTPEALVSEAARLAQLVGEGGVVSEWSPMLSAWFDQYAAACRNLAEFADWDAKALRSAAGPPVEPEWIGRRLLINAALDVESREVAGWRARANPTTR